MPELHRAKSHAGQHAGSMQEENREEHEERISGGEKRGRGRGRGWERRERGKSMMGPLLPPHYRDLTSAGNKWQLAASAAADLAAIVLALAVVVSSSSHQDSVLVKGVQQMHSRMSARAAFPSLVDLLFRLSPRVLSLDKVELLKQVRDEVKKLQAIVHKERVSTDKANGLEEESDKAERLAAQALADAKSVKKRLAARRAAAKEAFRRAQGVAFFALVESHRLRLESGAKAQDAIDREGKTRSDENKVSHQIQIVDDKIQKMDKELNVWKRRLVAQRGWIPFNQAA
ncbi:hypothetical protein GUITHDRAFT_148388 [Guillardia theta CCMP2712]|uniref:Uncharacterized protein n=1 Tax=Guillardia theta (strain CCMP2712) TaxID=905079 RepID=L1IA81_GUITC|nr:hypothetical protein GUITHDRAFT_148388 [Guillardia theta CCMP2712]EKX32750.1 hypothetical protein GUITHDRAFT_148388 [Guillardia theta CCMP2712]|eukprot:XP_005819730.1 hypothetical protein GUITHDRAFT_148388 [Guillardia theta CCMP2712]